MRLIDADAFIQMMEKKCDPESTLDPWVLSVCRGGVKMMPTVDAVPVVRGRWNCSDDAYESAVCSCCGWDTTEPWVHIKEWFNFCPHCGADMRKDGERG